jgi:hypothetical protein
LRFPLFLSIRRINDSFPKIQWYWTDVDTGIEARCRHCVLLNAGALTEKSALITYAFQLIPVARSIDALPLPFEALRPGHGLPTFANNTEQHRTSINYVDTGLPAWMSLWMSMIVSDCVNIYGRLVFHAKLKT